MLSLTVFAHLVCTMNYFYEFIFYCISKYKSQEKGIWFTQSLRENIKLPFNSWPLLVKYLHAVVLHLTEAISHYISKTKSDRNKKISDCQSWHIGGYLPPYLFYLPPYYLKTDNSLHMYD